MTDDREKKQENLIHLLQANAPIGIGFSGGVDSTFLCAIAAYNHIPMLAVTIQTMFQKPDEVKRAHEIAATLDIPHIVYHLNIRHALFTKENPKDRCYHCKHLLFSTVQKIAYDHQISYIADGSTVDDIPKERPGMKALQQLGVYSPLLETGFTKQDIRALSQKMSLSTWNLRSESCYATRIPYGTSITRERI